MGALLRMANIERSREFVAGNLILKQMKAVKYYGCLLCICITTIKQNMCQRIKIFSVANIPLGVPHRLDAFILKLAARNSKIF